MTPAVSDRSGTAYGELLKGRAADGDEDLVGEGASEGVELRMKGRHGIDGNAITNARNSSLAYAMWRQHGARSQRWKLTRLDRSYAPDRQFTS